jgi:hypothetical protein
MRLLFPELIVGDTEPTPLPVSAVGLAEWLDAYQRAVGEPFAFLHLDMDWGLPNWEQLAHDVQARAAARGVPLGMIYNGGAAPTRHQWIQLAGERVKTFDSTGQAADHAVFQSWMVQPDHTLPETDPTTFAGFVDQYVEDYDSLGIPTSGTGANLALRRPVKASAARPDSPAAAVVDGDFDTTWSAGAGPVQSIEITLDGPQDVASIRLTVAQFPDGLTDHRVFGRTASGKLQLLQRFGGVTTDGATLVASGEWHDLVAIRVETRTSPSWVAWREIEVLSP